MFKGKKEQEKKIISTICCCLLLLTLVVSMAKFLGPEKEFRKYTDFYSCKNDYDVLFLGTSRITIGISPMELWKDYGITSYNLGNYSQTIPLSYWVFKNALNYADPKLIVIDVWDIDKDYKDCMKSQEVFDYMPLNLDKIDAVYDLYPAGERMRYLFNFALYHTRWDEIDAAFWQRDELFSDKGADLD